MQMIMDGELQLERVGSIASLVLGLHLCGPYLAVTGELK